MSACCLAQTPGQSPYEIQKNIEIFFVCVKKFLKKKQQPPPALLLCPCHQSTHDEKRSLHKRCTPLRSVCATYTGRPSPTDAASHSLTRHHPSHPAHDRSPANAVPSTALHLLTSTRPPEPQANRSTAPTNRSVRFTSLRFHCAQSVSAVQRKRTLIGAALRFAPFAQPCRARGPTDAAPYCPHPRQHPPPKPTQQRTASLPPPSRKELASFRRRSASTLHAAP